MAGILFGLKADDISTAVVDSNVDQNSTLTITTPLTVDPISEFVNNVRFAVNGFAADGAFAGIDLRMRAVFKFKIPEASRITVFGHLTHHGVSTVSGRRSSWLFDWAGFAKFGLSARMRVRVRGANDQIVFTRNSPTRTLFNRAASGKDGTQTLTDVVFADIMEEFLTVAPPDVVLPEDTIYVRMQYNITAFAMDGAEFVADFDATGGGLNVPMVVLNF